jgi:hypothetical protein
MNNDFTHNQELQKIVAKVLGLLQGEQNISSLEDKATIPLKSKNLIA